jgi:shikimate kinase
VAPSTDPVRRVVLLGMMAAGKSAVGRGLADALGWRHVDLDAEVERAAGSAVSEIFAREGEPGFRAREAAATVPWADAERVVLSPGGGWAAQPGLLDSLGRGTLSVWLRVSPAEALRRAAAAPGVRPLLAGDAPLAALHRLLERREPLYARADLALDTDGTRVDDLVHAILTEIRSRGTAGEGTDD